MCAPTTPHRQVKSGAERRAWMWACCGTKKKKLNLLVFFFFLLSLPK